MTEVPQDEVELSLLKTGLGSVTQSDVEAAALAEASIFAFNVGAVPPDVKVTQLCFFVNCACSIRPWCERDIWVAACDLSSALLACFFSASQTVVIPEVKSAHSSSVAQIESSRPMCLFYVCCLRAVFVGGDIRSQIVVRVSAS